MTTRRQVLIVNASSNTIGYWIGGGARRPHRRRQYKKEMIGWRTRAVHCKGSARTTTIEQEWSGDFTENYMNTI